MALGDWRTATKRIRPDHESRGEVVELHALPLENRAHACREAMRRLESAITEVAEAIVEYEGAQEAFVLAVTAAGTGTSCARNTVNVPALTDLLAERLADIQKRPK